MSKKTFLLIMCLLAVQQLASASDWRLIHDGEDWGFAKTYVDMQTFKVKGDVVSYWQREYWSHNREMAEKANQPLPENELYRREMDCKKGMIRTLSGVIKGTNGEVMKTLTPDKDFRLINPKSREAKFQKMICDLAKEVAAKPSTPTKENFTGKTTPQAKTTASTTSAPKTGKKTTP